LKLGCWLISGVYSWWSRARARERETVYQLDVYIFSGTHRIVGVL